APTRTCDHACMAVPLPFLRQPSPSFHIPYLFFQRSPHLRDLHSFPTRRSSDLALVILADIHLFTLLAAAATDRTFLFDPQVGDRSEEHTSELQSRENLVCRLLLEKKKTTKPCNRTVRTNTTPKKQAPPGSSDDS